MFHYAVSTFSSVIFRFAVSTFDCDISLVLSTFSPVPGINGYCLSSALNLSASYVFSYWFSDHANHGANVAYNFFFKNKKQQHFFFFFSSLLLLRVRNRWRRRPCQPWLALLSSPDVEGAACKPHCDVFIWLPATQPCLMHV